MKVEFNKQQFIIEYFLKELNIGASVSYRSGLITMIKVGNFIVDFSGCDDYYFIYTIACTIDAEFKNILSKIEELIKKLKENVCG